MVCFLSPCILIRERRCPISRKSSGYRVNEAIRAPKVRLIGPNGENLGIVPREEALRQAAAYQLDLVEIAPHADPPVCRIVDYGKFLYERKKKEKESRKKQARTEVKEMRLRPRTAAHDRNIKVREAREWLEAGKKVRVVVLFRSLTRKRRRQGSNLVVVVRSLTSQRMWRMPFGMNLRRIYRMARRRSAVGQRQPFTGWYRRWAFRPS